MKRFLFIFVLVVISFTSAYAQPFIEEIRDFKKGDSIAFPPVKANLFVGSSSLRMWTDIQSYFPGYKIINRGFGGSSLPDVIRYADEIIYPYNPKKIFVYCGENDLAASDTVTAETVTERFKQLFYMIRSKWSKVPVVFISIKPSPSRAHLMPKMVQANQEIKTFLNRQKHTQYIDIYSLMLGADGQPNKELFIGDQLHMNAKGYAIWQKAIFPYLKK